MANHLYPIPFLLFVVATAAWKRSRRARTTGALDDVQRQDLGNEPLAADGATRMAHRRPAATAKDRQP
jgi:hypothetical protein